jgi:hypothetical protein
MVRAENVIEYLDGQIFEGIISVDEDSPPHYRRPSPDTRQRNTLTSRREVALDLMNLGYRCREIIVKYEQPVRVAELYIELNKNDALRMKGYSLWLFANIIWKIRISCRLVKLKEWGFWLAEREWRPSNYHPMIVPHRDGKTLIYEDQGTILGSSCNSNVETAGPVALTAV